MTHPDRPYLLSTVLKPRPNRSTLPAGPVRGLRFTLLVELVLAAVVVVLCLLF